MNLKSLTHFLVGGMLVAIFFPSLLLHAAETNLIANPSFETQNPTNANLPQSWVKDQWGTKTSTFTYQKTVGHTGTRSGNVAITKYTSGDVKWSFNEVAVTPNTSYTYTDFYQSNVATALVLQTKDTANKLSYKDLTAVPAATAWTQASTVFTTSATAKAVTVFHLLNKVGSLSLDDVYLGLTSATAPTSPSVSITSPTASANLSGVVAVNASASDAVAVAGVQFKLDGVNLGTEDTVAPYTVSWNTASTTNGAHVLTAVARNSQNLSTTSAAVNVTVTNTVVPLPTVSISAPVANTTVSDTVNVTATATNAAGVQFKLDGVNLGTEVTTAPYSYSWDTTTATNGSHILTAVARNSLNQTVTSSSVTVTVNNVPLPTVSISAPLANATVSGTTSVTTTATNAVGVQFKLDGANLGTEVTTAPYSYSWDTTTATNGSHILTAVARNSLNQTVTSSSITVTVNNTVTPPATNLVANPSVETVDPANSAKPLAWTSGGWGTNTPVYTYENTGHNSSRSVKTQITSYSSGDAKWSFDAVNVTAGTAYDFTQYYMSTATTDVVVQYTDANGVNSYQWLATLGASANWTQYVGSFTVPSGIVKATVMQTLYSVGMVQIDDVYMTVKTPVDPGILTIPNGSLEQAALNNPNRPASWSTGSWGTNTPTYEYMNDGHTGTHSVKLTMSNYVDGDAKWFFNPITNLVPGHSYRFTTWYKTNTLPRAVVQFTNASGVDTYFSMPNPFPNGTTDWQLYSETFTVPLDAKSVTAFFFLNRNGWMQVDDQSLATYTPVGFNRALLTMSFDDGFELNNQTVLPMTAAYGFKTTQCYATQFVLEAPGNADLVRSFYNAGHEICSHTVTHPFLTGMTTAAQDQELSQSQATLQGIISAPVTTFASPYGDYDQAVDVEIAKYYRSHRTVDEGFNSKDNFNIYRIRVQNMTNITTLAQVQSWIDQAKATNTWLVLVYHVVDSNPANVGQYDTYTSDFAQQLQAISNSGITVKTYNAALDELVPQM